MIQRHGPLLPYRASPVRGPIPITSAFGLLSLNQSTMAAVAERPCAVAGVGAVVVEPFVVDLDPKQRPGCWRRAERAVTSVIRDHAVRKNADSLPMPTRRGIPAATRQHGSGSTLGNAAPCFPSRCATMAPASTRPSPEASLSPEYVDPRPTVAPASACRWPSASRGRAAATSGFYRDPRHVSSSRCRSGSDPIRSELGKCALGLCKPCLAGAQPLS